MSAYELPSAPSGAIVRDIGHSNETSQVARLLWLRALFGDASSGRRLEALVARMTEFFIPKGKALYVEGTTSDSMYFVVEGEIHHGTGNYTNYVSGDVLGFVDSMIDRPHRYTAMVTQDAIVLRLKIDDWLEHLEENFSELRQMFGRPRGANDAHPDDPPETSEQSWAQDANGAQLGATGELVRRLLAVKTCPLFHQTSIQAIAQLVRKAQTVTLAEGQKLPEQFERPGLFVLLSGQVSCSMGPDGETLDWETSTAGSLLGAVSVIRELPTIFEIVAQEPTELLYLDAEDYFDVMEDHFDVARSALRYFAVRSEAQNDRKQPN